MITKLLKGAKGYKAQSIATVVLVMCETLMEVILPMFMSYTLNTMQLYATSDVAKSALTSNLWYWDFSAGKGVTVAQGVCISGDSVVLRNTVFTYGILMVISAVFSFTCGTLAGKFCAIAGAGFSKNTRASLFAKIQDFSFANVDAFSTASLVTRCTTDVNNAQQSFMMLIRTVVRAPAMLIFSCIMAFVNQPDMAWVFLVAIPLLATAMAILSVKAYPLFRSMLKKYDKMNADVQEDLVAIRVVKAYVREDYEEEKYRQSAEEVRKSQFKAEKLMTYLNPIANAVMYGTIVALLIIGGNDMIFGGMQSGTLTAMMTYCTQILVSVMMICFIAVQLVLSKASIDRIYEVLETKSTILDGPSQKTVDSGNIVFDHVNFSYSDNEQNLTLTDIDLEIKEGQMVGIIGGTGEGKSSLVQLIPRFYDVLDGRVLVDGEDVRNYSLFNLREGVSMVLQKNVLFSGTIRENLLWGNKNASQEEIEAACKAACAHDFIMSFPDGYETDLGQGGVNVSGGQKQRLCIARALLKKPKIMILDDSTSAVDTATDAQIRFGLKKLDKNLTTIIIAQRISSVQDCDKIVVLDDGRINAVGTHDELMNTCSIYREIYNSQQKGAADDFDLNGGEH